MGKVEWEGLWEYSPTKFASKAFKLSWSDKVARLVIIRNYRWKAGSNHPKFVFALVENHGDINDVSRVVDVVDPDDCEFDDDSLEEVYTREDVMEIIHGTYRDAEYGHSFGDTLPEDFVTPSLGFIVKK